MCVCVCVCVLPLFPSGLDDGILRSGRYFHNIKMVNSTLWSMHVNEPLVNNNTFAKHLKEDGGYTVGMFGKYMNIMPKTVPPGFDAWMGNPGEEQDRVGQPQRWESARGH